MRLEKREELYDFHNFSTLRRVRQTLRQSTVSTDQIRLDSVWLFEELGKEMNRSKGVNWDLNAYFNLFCTFSYKHFCSMKEK